MADYDGIPTREQWGKDSWRLFGSRSADILLARIDALVGQYNEATVDSLKLFAVCDLWFTVDLWLRLCDKPPDPPTDVSTTINKGRRPAVYKLYKVVVSSMSSLTGVPINLLPNWLEASFGKRMHAHGWDVDDRQRERVYMTPQAVADTRLHFKEGKAYRKNDAGVLTLFNSADLRSTVIAAGWAGYACGWARDFYSTAHASNSIYHSSYFAGGRVACAGEIKVVAGVVQGINTDSGHYRPTEAHLMSAVQALAMYGVDVGQVQVKSFEHPVPRTGTVFLREAMAAVGSLTLGLQLNRRQREASAREEHEVQFWESKYGDNNPDLKALMQILDAAPIEEYGRVASIYQAHAKGKFHCERCRAAWNTGKACGLADGQIGQALPADNRVLVAYNTVQAKLARMRPTAPPPH